MKNYYKIDELYYPHAFVSERHTDVKCARHMHIAPELVIVTAGTLNMKVGDVEYRIERGKGIFVPPFTPHSFDTVESNECHVLTFAKELLGHVSEWVRNNRITDHTFDISPSLMRLVDEYLPEEKNLVDGIKAQAVLSPLFYEMYEGCRTVEGIDDSTDSLLSALEYTTKNFKNDITLSTVAERAGVHSVTLSRLFAQRTGITFSKFIKYLRATCAADMIKQGGYTFTEIAFASGFGSVRNFNRVFLEIYGITPREFKANNEKVMKK